MISSRPSPPLRSVLSAVLLAVLGLATASQAAAAGPGDEAKAAAAGGAKPGRVLLVRHAETAAGDDPELSEQGRLRAERLAGLLAEEGIERILATDTRRARATASPLARRLGLELEIYDPRALPDLAAELRRDGGVVLVVGHSNTTPALVRLLGGDPDTPIRHDEYDRLYRIELVDGETTLDRYSAP